MRSGPVSLAVSAMFATAVGAASLLAAGEPPSSHEDQAAFCVSPQTPRDITKAHGLNFLMFESAPASSELNLCNLHFHANAEHRGPGFLKRASAGDKRGGFICNMTGSLSASELAMPAGSVCADHKTGKGLKTGDTIEVHWVHTSCPVKTEPGKGLKLCVSCANPFLRVESQVFLLVNDPSATDFRKFDLASGTRDGYLHAKALPRGTGEPVTFRGSTTGPKQTNKCDPTNVTWNVRPRCAKLDINSLGEWCKHNKYHENHAHGIRPLVTDLFSLSRIYSSPHRY
ncbi:MAG TPA: delta-class carbonic anhydrase [Hyphomicrobiaceae bacterium]|nr:delta-class carbonic anhydrase [Hyphomicrobiaceae bacterium]